MAEGTGFRQPENYDCSQEGSGWRFWQGANDWETATTWMWVVFPDDRKSKRVWVEIDYEGHGQPDSVEKGGSPGNDQAKEAKAWGKKAVAAWLRIAKRLHSEKRENDSTRQWIDAFKDALQDKEMAPFIKSHGCDTSRWEPVKESSRVVTKLLEDDTKDAILAMDASQPFMRPYRIVIDDGEGGSFYVISYGVDSDSAISRAVESGRISFADAMSVQSVDLADEHGVEGGVHPIPESDEEVDDVLSRSKTGFCITATSRQSGATLYLAHRSWAGDQPWRFSSYEEDKFLFANAEEAEKVLPIARKQRPDSVLQVVITSPENKLPTHGSVAENEEADDPKDYVDSHLPDAVSATLVLDTDANPPGPSPLAVNALDYLAAKPADFIRRLLRHSKATGATVGVHFEQEDVVNLLQLVRAPKDYFDYAAEWECEAELNIHVNALRHWAKAARLAESEESEIEDLTDQVAKSRGYVVVGTGEAGQKYYMANSRDTRFSSYAKDAHVFTDKEMAQAMCRYCHEYYPHYQPRIEVWLGESEEADEFLDRVGDDKGEYVAILQGEAMQRPHYLNSHAHWSLEWSADVPCSQAEAMRRLIKNTSEHPTNAQFSKIVPRAEAFDYQSAWYASRNDVSDASIKKMFDLFFKFWGKGWDASGKRRHESLDEAVYKRSSCQINAPDDIKDFLIQWGMLNIPEKNLYVEADGGCGREDEPHVTVRYGLDFAEPPEEFHRLITSWQAFPIRLAGVSLFKNDKYDVVKLDVVSEDLVRLNAEIRRQFPSQEPDKFPDYHPHMTVAYVQKGTADQLEGADPFKESMDVAPEFQAERLRFSGAGDTEKGDRVIQFIPFNKSKSTEQRRAEEIVAEALEDEADEFLTRFGRFVIAMIAPEGYHASPVYLEPDGTYSYVVDSARIFLTRNEAEEELIRQRPLVDEEYTLKVVPLQDAKKVKPFNPSPHDFGESQEADDYLDRMKTCVLAIVPPPDADAFIEYLGENGEWGGIREAYVFHSREAAAVPLKKWQAHFEQKYGRKEDLRVRDYEAELRIWGLTPKTVREAEEDDVGDLLGRMEPRRYALRFNIRNPRYVGSVMIKPPWWDSHYWGAKGYSTSLSDAEDNRTFGHAWDARVSLADQLQLKVQDIEIVTHIGDKVIAVDPWPSRRGDGIATESLDDDEQALVDRVVQFDQKWVIRNGPTGNYWCGDPKVVANSPRKGWGTDSKSATVFNWKEHAAKVADELAVKTGVYATVHRLWESADAEVDDFLQRADPLYILVRKSNQGWHYFQRRESQAFWVNDEERATEMHEDDAKATLAAIRSLYADKDAYKLRLKRLGESASPFGPLNFPADATEVLTKIRARRNKRGAPAWF